MELMLAKDGRDVPALFMAMQNGHADAVRAYAKLLEAADMDANDVMELLLAKGVRDIPGLSMALQKGRSEAISAYAELVKATNISPDHLKALLLVQDERKFPALFIALRNGHGNAIVALGGLLQSASANAGVRREVLRALHKVQGSRFLGILFNRSFYDEMKAQQPDAYAAYKALKAALKQG